MAPGPNVEIVEDKSISFDSLGPTSPNFPSDGEAFPSDGEAFSKYKYYRSNRIPGRLFDAVDEHAVFNQVQNMSMRHSSHKRGRYQDSGIETLEAILLYIDEIIVIFNLVKSLEKTTDLAKSIFSESNGTELTRVMPLR
ncbi:hypothetical protein G7Y89_g14126 [Cudoniella acicularis]|uniref:Uncharacterized protein n=1 Tax=Cudoniella acicularis TaxID=354080 RepID=A0A8H4R8F4_9HELO|nr:hypothetical protein G7Y89_g14126 [Cudoniella acicularis]